jgi:peptide/nickel transport system ATP-binding protein
MSSTATAPAGATDPAVQPAPLLRVSGLRTEFHTAEGVVRAVDDVSFDIAAGEILGIVGESGSGKSVTARSILGMVHAPGRVVAGEVSYRGRDLRGLSAKAMREIRGREIGLVFQDPQSALNPVMTVRDQISEALTVHGMGRAAARERALELLEQVGIPDARRRADDYPHQFSGGMRQRVVIAIALANNPSLLIADEPTTALDVTIQAQILRLLGRLRRELGVAVLMITHDMGVVAETCDRLVVMYGGRVLERGTVEDVFRAPKSPYTHDLLAAMPRLDDTSAGRLPSIPGAPPDPAQPPSGCPFHARCRLAVDLCTSEMPALTTFSEDHLAACHVTAGGDPIPALVAEAARERPVTGPDARLILEVTDLRINVADGRRGLWRRPAPVYAVDGVSLHVRAGETLGLVGESGCGKSTLARAIVGINRPASGSVTIREGGAVQYVFQDPSASLNPRRTIRESIDEAFESIGVPAAQRYDESVRLLERVGLNARHLERLPYAFSGGQRQRVGIARALAARPQLLVLDEPVSALDVSIQAQIINLLESLRDELDLGYLFIAHDLSVVRHLSDRVAVMYLGDIVETGEVGAVYGSPQHPYTAALLASSPIPDPATKHRERIVLKGDLPSPKDPPSGCRFRTRCPIGPTVHSDRTICIEERPRLVLTASGAHAACHFTGELTQAGL